MAAEFDHWTFDHILKTYVDSGGRVDYNGIAADNTFREYMRSLETAEADAQDVLYRIRLGDKRKRTH